MKIPFAVISSGLWLGTAAWAQVGAEKSHFPPTPVIQSEPTDLDFGKTGAELIRGQGDDQGNDVYIRDLSQNFVGESGGNLVGIQPAMRAQDYRTAADFEARLAYYLDQVVSHGFCDRDASGVRCRPERNTVVVFPELIGLYLLWVDEKVAHLGFEKFDPYADQALGATAPALILNHKAELFGQVGADVAKKLWSMLIHPKQRLQFKSGLFNPSGAADPALQELTKAVFTVKAQAAATAYYSAFSDLAKKYGVTIVAGSVLLPNPGLVGDDLVINQTDEKFGGTTHFYNVGIVFGPDGKPLDSIGSRLGGGKKELYMKAFPTREEALSTGATGMASLGEDLHVPVYYLPGLDPAGRKMRLAATICADSWYPQVARAIHRETSKDGDDTGINLLAVPAYSDANDMHFVPWGGYNIDAPLEWAIPYEKNRVTQSLDLDDIVDQAGDIAHDQQPDGSYVGLSERGAWIKYAMPGRIEKSSDNARLYGITVYLRHGQRWVTENGKLVSKSELWQTGSDGAPVVYATGLSSAGQETAPDVWVNEYRPADHSRPDVATVVRIRVETSPLAIPRQ